MTEAEWLAWRTAPAAMLDAVRGKASERKVRLFIVGCCRRYRIETEIPDQKSWDAVHVAEWYADGNGARSDLEAARRDAEAFAGAGCPAALHATADDVWQGAVAMTQIIERMWQCDDYWEEVRAQKAILHDVLGPLPFRPVALDLGSSTPAAVTALAHAIYEERRFQDLPILADALEEAGCSNAEVLTHCRQPGEHVRGCWVLDLILGKS